MNRTLLFVLSAWALAGCAGSSPSISEYTILPSPTPEVRRGVPYSAATLRIAPTRSLPSLSSRAIYYVRGENEIGTYLYSRWSDTPSSMIERFLASSLEEHRVFSALLPSNSSAQGSRLLESDLAAFYHRFLADGSSEGVIDITYRLVDPHSKTTIASRRFQIAAPAPTNDAAGGVHALSSATRLLGEQCTQWLIQLQEKP